MVSVWSLNKICDDTLFELACWVPSKGPHMMSCSNDLLKTHSLPAVSRHPNISECFPPQLLRKTNPCCLLLRLPLPHHRSRGAFPSQDPGNNFNLFSLDTSATSAPQGPSTPAPLPPTWYRAISTTLGLGQQEVRPKGQRTVASCPHASRLRMQLCSHGNVQSRAVLVPSRSSRAPHR